MNVLHTIDEFRAYRRSIPPHVLTPFVPTMGALHEGHASLVRQARAMSAAGRVLSSIFVNPAQFGPSEDFTRYPRTLEADLALLKQAGADAVFVPSAQEMYPAPAPRDPGTGLQNLTVTSLDPGVLAHVLEGKIRPGHFRGVCTVVAKLLNITLPSHLILGQKDYQQQAVLRQMIADLNMPVEVITCPTVREADGLAMSSRNRYLSADERSRAVGLHEALCAARTAYEGGEREASVLEQLMHSKILARGLEPQYAVTVDAQTLACFPGMITAPAVLLVAAKLGATRLIDNMLL